MRSASVNTTSMSCSMMRSVDGARQPGEELGHADASPRATSRRSARRGGGASGRWPARSRSRAGAAPRTRGPPAGASSRSVSPTASAAPRARSIGTQRRPTEPSMPVAAAAPGGGGESEVLPHRQPREDVRALERARDPAARHRVRAGAAIGRALEEDAPGGGREVARDQVEQRRLAGAVRPDDGPPLARRDRQGHAVDGRQRAEAAGGAPRARGRARPSRAEPDAAAERADDARPGRRGRRERRSRRG